MSKPQFVITHDPNDLTFLESITAWDDYENGFKYTITTMLFKTAEFHNFIKEVQTEINELQFYDYSRNKTTISYKHLGENVRIYATGNHRELYVDVFSKSEKLNEKIWKLYLKHSKDDSDEIDIYNYTFFIVSNNKVDKSFKILKPKELEFLSEKYYPYVDTEIMFDQFFTGNENILLLVGEPGIGKSKLSTLAIKHAHKNYDKLPYDKMADDSDADEQYVTVGYIKSTEILNLEDLWRELENLKIDIVIIDDLDYMLTKRDSEVLSSEDVMKNSFLKQFLSFTDGVVKSNTKFIITTNQNYSEIDQALLRKGRLFDIIELRRLDKNEALEIWEDNGLKHSEFTKNFKEHNILPADLGSIIAKHKNSRIDSALKSYLKEDGISKIKKAGRIKKIGI